MPRITPIHHRILECIFQKDGFKFIRQKGDHKLYEKEGVSRPIVIPEYKEIDRDIITALMRTAGMSRERYFDLLKQCK